MKVRFLELAQYELDDAFVWYEEQMQGLGRERGQSYIVLSRERLRKIKNM